MEIIILCIILIPNLAFSENHKPSLSQILEIANNKATAVGYDINRADVVIFENCIPGEVLFPADTLSRPELGVKSKLGTRTYWAVLYIYMPEPNTYGAGGDLTIFIDATTGEILEIFRTA